MKTCYAYRFDIDNTIAQPLFFNRDVPTCIQYYIQASIITPEETTHVQSHPHLYIPPQVALTHLPLPGAVEALQHLAQEGASIQYFTVRQSVESEQCQRIRQNTHVWLERHQFPCPMQVRFCRNLAEKLVQALEASEPYILLIDDRPGQLLQAYEKVAEYGPQIAQQIRERVILVGFWCRDLAHLPSVSQAPRVLPLASWSHFDDLLASMESSS